MEEPIWISKRDKKGKYIRGAYIKCNECNEERWIYQGSYITAIKKGTFTGICLKCQRKGTQIGTHFKYGVQWERIENNDGSSYYATRMECKSCGKIWWYQNKRNFRLGKVSGLCGHCNRKVSGESNWINNSVLDKYDWQLCISKNGFRNYKTLVTCPKCGTEKRVARYAMMERIKVDNLNNMCRTCRIIEKQKDIVHPTGEESPSWKGGICIRGKYRAIRIYKDSPLYSMSHGGYIQEHRYIIANNIGRCLESWEHVHHINGDKLDNRIENLELLPDYKHSTITHIVTENKKMAKRIKELELQLT